MEQLKKILSCGHVPSSHSISRSVTVGNAVPLAYQQALSNNVLIIVRDGKVIKTEIPVSNHDLYLARYTGGEQ